MMSIENDYTGNVLAQIADSRCSIEIKDNKEYYTCFMLLKYVVNQRQFQMNIVITGPTLYISGEHLNIEYNIHDPYDIRIKQLEKREIGEIFIVCSALMVVVLWIVSIVQTIFL
jgi:hypothetical protein